MNQPQLATCQCIIAHPSKPKFLAIKHQGGHLPPTVKVPLEFDIGKNIAYVLDGVRRKYGLETVALRQLARFSDYQCIELELLGRGSRRMQAVWVGLEDYQRIRGTDRGGYDPLADWLADQVRETVPSERPPWERRGWFKKARHWIDFQLDRLGIQATGSVRQQHALAHRAALLRVPTSSGNLLFRAAYERPPKEGPLLRFLAQNWPECVSEPVAFDDARNWMLAPDYGPVSDHPKSPDDFARAAATMARIQVQSVDWSRQLRDLGCEPVGPDRLKQYLTGTDLLGDMPAMDAGGLAEAERVDLMTLARTLAEDCDRLAEFGLPAMLVHPDFHAANIFLQPDSVRIVNWTNCGMGHPFFSLMPLLRQAQAVAPASLDQNPVVASYLPAFQGFAAGEQLLEALELVIRLDECWRLLHWIQEFPYLEAGSVTMVRVQGIVTQLARQLLAAHR